MLLFLLLLLPLDHIENPQNLKNAKVVTLVKDLTLGGADADDDQLFSGTTSLVATPDGRLYVLDSGNFRVQVFDKKGRLVNSFGEKGPGPGEFAEPVAITLDASGNVMIFDTGTHKMALFKGSGEFIREQRFENGIHGLFQPVGLPGGFVAFTCYKLDQDLQMGYHQVVFDESMKQVQSLRILPIPKLDWDQAENPAFWVDFLSAQLDVVAKGWPLQARAGDRLVTMHTAEYQGNLYTPGKAKPSTFSKKFKPRAISDEAKEALCEPMWQSLAANPAISDNMGVGVFNRALARVETLLRMPPVSGLAPLGDGFAVLADYNPLEHRGNVDIFDRNGKLKAQTAYTGAHDFFTGAGNYLYVAGPDEDDNIVVERFRVEGL